MITDPANLCLIVHVCNEFAHDICFANLILPNDHILYAQQINQFLNPAFVLHNIFCLTNVDPQRTMGKYDKQL